MKKILFVLLSVFSLVSVYAQKKVEFSKRKEMMESAQTLFDDYLRIIRTGMIKDDTASINGFRRLFTDDARIYDDLCLDTAAMYDDLGSFRFKKEGLRNRGIEEYISHNTLVFPGGSNSNIKNLNFTFFKINSGVFKVVFEKESEGITNLKARRRFIVKNLDTLEMTIEFDKKFENPRIAGIERVGRKVTKRVAKASPKEEYFVCLNNKDCDDLPDLLDECPTVPGYDPFGCPSAKAINGFTVWGGLFFPRTTVGTLNESQLGYGTLRKGVLPYDAPALTTKPLGAGFKLTVEYDIWFSKFKNIGFSFGGTYGVSRNTFELNNPYTVAFQNEEKSDASRKFTQIITTKSAIEVSTFHAFSLPVHLKYSTRGSAKKDFNYFVHIGAIIPLSLISVSNSTYKASYNAQYAGFQTHRFQSGEITTSSDWIISQDQASKATTDETVQKTYFDRKQAAGYNVSPEIEKTAKNTNFRTPSIGLSVRLGFTKKLGTRGRNLVVAGEFSYINNGLPTSGDNYVMTRSATESDYKALSSVMRQMNTWSIGGLIAYQWKLYKKVSKNTI